MTDIAKLEGISTDTANLRSKGIQTDDDLWMYIGRDLDRGIDDLAVGTTRDTNQWIEFLSQLGVHEAEGRNDSRLKRWLALYWLDGVIAVALVPVLVLLLRALGGLDQIPVLMRHLITR
jgi:hypothetical protein